jgi:lysophospholipase L1-like esterase
LIVENALTNQPKYGTSFLQVFVNIYDTKMMVSSSWIIWGDAHGRKRPRVPLSRWCIYGIERITMLTILCYGDSNTWGCDPTRAERLDRFTRWPGVVQQEFAGQATILEEGLGSRTTNLDDPFYEGKNGRSYLIAFLESHAPIDAVAIMLGTNDLKQQYHRSASEVAQAAGLLVGLTQRSSAGPGGSSPKVLFIAPPLVGPLSETVYADMYAGAEEKSRLFGREYRQIATIYQCAYLNAGEIVSTSRVDGIHLEASEHIKLGHAVAEALRLLLMQQ